MVHKSEWHFDNFYSIIMNRLRQFLVGQATLVDWDYNLQKESFAQLRKSDNRGGGPV